MQIIPIHMLPAGQTARVCDVSGDAQMVLRLDEMGLREGTVIQVVQTGQPCIIAFEDHRLSFRGEDGVSVLVEVGS